MKYFIEMLKAVLKKGSNKKSPLLKLLDRLILLSIIIASGCNSTLVIAFIILSTIL